MTSAPARRPARGTEFIAGTAKADGAKVGALSPWNEPNHPSFISPQRATCDAHAPLLSPAVYAKLAGAARDELKGTNTKLVLGELAGKVAPSPVAAGVAQHAQVLGDARLADVQLRDQVADRARTVEQLVEDPAAGGLGEHVEHSWRSIYLNRNTCLHATRAGIRRKPDRCA